MVAYTKSSIEQLISSTHNVEKGYFFAIFLEFLSFGAIVVLLIDRKGLL